MGNIEKKRKYLDKDGNTILEVENGADAANVDISQINGINSTTAQGAIEELNTRLGAVEGSEGGGGSVVVAASLVPIQVWSDDFALDRTVSHYVKSKMLINQSYDGGTSDRQYYEFTSTPAERTAYQFFGNCAINRSNVFTAHVPFGASGDKMILNQVYTADQRDTVWLVQMVDANAAVKVGFEMFSFYSDSETITNPAWKKCFVGASDEGNGSLTVNFGTAKIGSTDMGFTPAVGHCYFVIIKHNGLSSSVTVTDANDSTKTKTVSGYGELKCAPYIEWVAGSFNVRKVAITIYGANCDYYITGDSILMNKAVTAAKRWAYKFKNEKCPNTVISGRGTSGSMEVALRMMSEIQYLRPKCVIDQNFVNGYVQGQVDALNTLCGTFGGRYIHTMPTISATMAYNFTGKSYLLRFNAIRFDAATSINGDVTQGQDTSKFVEGLHPNDKGSLAMYEQLINELGL